MYCIYVQATARGVYSYYFLLFARSNGNRVVVHAAHVTKTGLNDERATCRLHVAAASHQTTTCNTCVMCIIGDHLRVWPECKRMRFWWCIVCRAVHHITVACIFVCCIVYRGVWNIKTRLGWRGTINLIDIAWCVYLSVAFIRYT